MSATEAATTRSIHANDRPHLPLASRLIYGLGDFASGFIWSTTGSYLAIFYTDAVGIAASVVGALMLTARVLDAVIDPVVGALAERTRSKYGRFRPWILYGMVPLAVLAVLTFTAPFPGDTTLAVVFAAVTYGLLGFAYSAVNLPYGAVASVMAETPADRVSMNSFRFIGSQVAGIIIGLMTFPLIQAFGGGKLTTHGYTLTIALFAVVTIPLFYLVFRSSRETIVPVSAERVPLASSLKALLHNGPFLVFLVVTLLSLIALFGRLGAVVYYFSYNVGTPGAVPLLMTTNSVAMVVGTLAFSRFARRIGKKNLLIVGFAIQAVALFALYFVGSGNLGLVVVLSVVVGIGGFSISMLFSMISDVIDYGEHKTGVRTDGLAYAVFSFSTKLASALAAIGVSLIGAFGYVPNQTQTPEALAGINLVVNLLPALMTVASIVVLLGYRLTDAQAAQIRTELRAAADAARKADDSAMS